MLHAPTTKELCRLESEVARFGNNLLLVTLANADTPELVAASEARDRVINALIDLGQSLGAEMAIRRTNSCAKCFDTDREWIESEVDRPTGSRPTDLERVKAAETEALGREATPVPGKPGWWGYSPGPITAGLAELKDVFLYGRAS